jgi:predicted DNA-binding protein
MLSSEKKLKLLSEKLNNNNPSIVLDAIEHLRSEDPFPGAVQLLAEVFDRSENKSIRDKISAFMNDMKESSARSEVIEEVKKGYKNATVCMLVSSCWQSGLDYSPYAQDIAYIFNSGDYATALECFTVIEESVQYLDLHARQKVIGILMKSDPANTPEKSVLMHELVAVLS